MKIYLVGGAVRNEILSRESHDNDYVVVGSSPEEMLNTGFTQVSKSFPVFLHPETREEYALARKEVKTGEKHTSFEFDFSPGTSLREDLERRDITINALAKDLETGEIIDYFNGLKDLQDGVVKHIGSHFVEDPLRVLRVCRQAAELSFSIAPETVSLCRKMCEEGALKHLSSERIWAEIEKALRTCNFYSFIENLDLTGALEVVLPEIHALKGVPEREEYHPEGNTFEHIMLSLMVAGRNHQGSSLLAFGYLNFCILCHDLGKLKTKETWPSHHAHDKLGVEMVESLCNRLKIPNKYKEVAQMCCKYHMKIHDYKSITIKKHYDIINEITKFKRINLWKLNLLLDVCSCDLLGRAKELEEDKIKQLREIRELMIDEFLGLEDVEIKDLDLNYTRALEKLEGEKFGKVYRDAKISYLKRRIKS